MNDSCFILILFSVVIGFCLYFRDDDSKTPKDNTIATDSNIPAQVQNTDEFCVGDALTATNDNVGFKKEGDFRIYCSYPDGQAAHKFFLEKLDNGQAEYFAKDDDVIFVGNGPRGGFIVVQHTPTGKFYLVIKKFYKLKEYDLQV